MSTTMHLPAHSWASAHQALLTVFSVLLAVTLAVVVTLFVTRSPASDRSPSGNLFPDRTTGEGSCYSTPVGTGC